MNPLRVLTYNVSWGVLSDDVRSSEGQWVERCRRRDLGCADRVQALIDRAEADLLFLQEFVPDRLRFDPKRYQVLTWKSGMEMGRTGRLNGKLLATRSIGDQEGRPALAAYLPELRLVAASLHAGHDAEARDRDLGAFFRDIDANINNSSLSVASVIVGGDFNGRCTRRLKCGGHALLSPATWPKTCCRKTKLTMQTMGDAILASGAPAPQARIVWEASDHDPVVGIVGGSSEADRQAALLSWSRELRLQLRGVKKNATPQPKRRRR